MKNSGCIILVFLLIFFVGCSSIVKTNVVSTLDDSNDLQTKVVKQSALEDYEGVSYYLPKRKIKLQFVRENVNEKKLKKQVGVQTKKVESAAADVSRLKQIVSNTTLVSQEVGSPGKEEISKKLAIAEAELAIAKKAKEKADKEYAIFLNAFAKSNYDAASAKFLDTIKIELLPVEPDTSILFMAKLDHHFNRSDDLKLSTDDSGLLISVKAQSEDETPRIIENMTKTIIEIVKIASGVPIPSALEVAVQPKPLMPFSYVREFDSTKKNERDDVFGDIKKLTQGEYVFTIKRPAYEYSLNEIPRSISGVVYRRSMPYTINVKQVLEEGNSTEEGSVTNKYSKTFMLPNKGPIAVLPLEAGPFVKTDYDVEFNHGMLTKHNAKRPSEGRGLTAIPLFMAKAVAAVPASILQLKIDYSSKQKELLEAQKLKFEAEESLRKKKGAIEESGKEVSSN